MKWRRKRRAQREREQSEARTERAEREVTAPLRDKHERIVHNHMVAVIAQSLRMNGGGS